MRWPGSHAPCHAAEAGFQQSHALNWPSQAVALTAEVDCPRSRFILEIVAQTTTRRGGDLPLSGPAAWGLQGETLPLTRGRKPPKKPKWEPSALLK